jgi:hypothetical protein
VYELNRIRAVQILPVLKVCDTKAFRLIDESYGHTLPHNYISKDFLEGKNVTAVFVQRASGFVTKSFSSAPRAFQAITLLQHQHIL